MRFLKIFKADKTQNLANIFAQFEVLNPLKLWKSELEVFVTFVPKKEYLLNKITHNNVEAEWERYDDEDAKEDSGKATELRQ